MKSSLKIGSVMGIPIRLHITFLLILPMFAYVFAINPQPFGFEGVEPPITKYSLSVLTAILLFASILLHELAHSYMAMRYGVKIESITLFLFGGSIGYGRDAQKTWTGSKNGFCRASN